MLRGSEKLTAWMLAVCLAAPVAAEAGEAKRVSEKRAGNCENPMWSRDGESLAYERVFYDDKKIELNVIRDIDAPKEARIRPKLEEPDESGVVAAFKKGKKKGAKPGDVCRELAWGPKDSASSFVYACNVAGASYQLFLTEGDQLTHGAHAAGQPDLSPVGWKLAFLSAEGGKEGIYVIHDLLEEIRPVRLLGPSTRVDRMPAWSPDGKKLAFVGHDEESADLYVVENVRDPRESLIRLTKWPGEEINPAWSPDGTRIAFFADRAGDDEKKRRKRGRGKASHGLYVLDLKKGGEPFLVVDDVVASEQRGPAWTPDGKTLVYVKDYQRGRMVDPIRAARAEPGAREMKLKTGTVSNKDPQVVARGDAWWLAFSAQGRLGRGSKTWRKVYIMPVDGLRVKP